jgi:hypothetical protein
MAVIKHHIPSPRLSGMCRSQRQPIGREKAARNNAAEYKNQSIRGIHILSPYSPNNRSSGNFIGQPADSD